MLRRLPKTRRYNYSPQVKPKEAEEGANRKPKIKFRKAYHAKKGKRSYLALVLLLFITIFIIQYIGRYQLKSPDSIKMQQPEILR